MEDQLRLPLFLYAGLCTGLPTVIWTFYDLRHHQNAGGTISAFIVSLIISETVELLLSPFLITWLGHAPNTLGMPCLGSSSCWVLLSSFAEARLCGLHFHQLVALEGIVYMMYPLSPPPHPLDFFFPLMLSLGIFLCVVICNLFSTGYNINLIFCVVPVILALITIVLAFRLPYSSNAPLRRRCPSFTVLAVGLFTLLLYMPCLVLSLINFPLPFYASPWATTVVPIMSFRLVTEPLLCVLVSNEALKTQALQRLSVAKRLKTDMLSPDPSDS